LNFTPYFTPAENFSFKTRSRLKRSL
jgi:hypothetical protein